MGRARLTDNDRWFFVQLYRWFSVDPSGSHDCSTRYVWYVGIGPAFAAIGVGNHVDGEGDRRSRRKLRALIRQMSRENFLWGAPRIHGELLKLGV